MHMQSSEPSRAGPARSAAEIRAWIAGEIAKLLQVEATAIDPSAPLHSHGVDSLAAIGISAGLSAWMGCDVPATLMWDYDSIDAIAEAMAAGNGVTQAADLPVGVVALQPRGSRRPLFCFPGLAGQAQTFAPLASCLDRAQPCFGLSMPEADEAGRPITRIEQIAAAMLTRVRMVQPGGPFQFVGYSMGGMIAYEAAQQLMAAGQSVSMLAVFDSFAPAGRVLRPRWQRLMLHTYLLALHRGRRRYFAELVRSRRARRRAAHPDAPAGAAGAHDFVMRCMQAADEYNPRPYRGTVILFQATQRPAYNRFFKLDPTNGWGALAEGGVRVVELAGGHMNLIDAAHAPAAAEALMRQLNAER